MQARLHLLQETGANCLPTVLLELVFEFLVSRCGECKKFKEGVEGDDPPTCEVCTGVFCSWTCHKKHFVPSNDMLRVRFYPLSGNTETVYLHRKHLSRAWRQFRNRLLSTARDYSCSGCSYCCYGHVFQQKRCEARYDPYGDLEDFWKFLDEQHDSLTRETLAVETQYLQECRNLDRVEEAYELHYSITEEYSLEDLMRNS